MESLTSQADDAFAGPAPGSPEAVAKVASTISPHGVVAYKYTGPTVVNIGKLSRMLYFRQSMLHDYMTCPQMAYYRWIAGIEQVRTQFFSAFLGTAGHEVLYLMHTQRKFNYTWLELMELFEQAFWKAVNASTVPPTIGKHYKSVQEQFIAEAPEYVKLLEGYQLDPRNHNLYEVMHEQAFVLQVQSNEREYLFTGQIDMGCFKQDGNFVLRDYKFRQNAFKPNWTQLNLDPQFTLYDLACVKGYPACDVCRPQYEGGTDADILRGGSDGEIRVVYKGPCEACKNKIRSKRWPRRWANPCELIWMRDYERREKDQHPRYIKDHSLPKVRGGKTGKSMVLQESPNPEWGSGYKKGDYVGKCVYPTYRDPALLDTLLGDILRMCDSILRGEFYRRPGEACAFWCAFREPCQADVKTEVNEKHLMEATSFGSTSLED